VWPTKLSSRLAIAWVNRLAWILAIPLEMRLAVLFLFGVVLAGGLNLAIYALAWNPRPISPWSKPPEGADRRTMLDCLPIWGWWRLRRESNLHGRAFWIRPILIELGVGASFAALYWWETVELGLLIRPELIAPPVGAFLNSNVVAIVHAQFAAHVLLFMLMLVASFIDIDEKIIPDTITVPGTLMGLLLATVLPWCLLDGYSWMAVPGIEQHEFMTICSPNRWAAVLSPAPQATSLIIAFLCWWGWCFAIMPRRWMTRRGLLIAFKVLCTRLRREPLTWWIVGLGVLGSAAIFAVWQFATPVTWAGLLTALVGMAGGGGIVWIVRVVGSGALGREAMGFGDVTLMAMIGTLVGWQASLAIFFLAPFAGLLIGGVQWILHRENEIPYGPFLCLATAFVVVTWSQAWEGMMQYFEGGWLVPAVLAVVMLLLGIVLKVLFGRPR
jgi:leader peptidase (prepilin peptidase) / N-methyltransferase